MSAQQPKQQKQLQFPDSVLVLGERFRIELVPDFRDNDGESVLFGDTGSDVVGGFYRIRINSDLDTRTRWRTLVHEHVHAALCVSGVSNVLPDEVEEVVAQSLEHATIQLLRQFGKQLVQHLGEE